MVQILLHIMQAEQVSTGIWYNGLKMECLPSDPTVALLHVSN